MKKNYLSAKGAFKGFIKERPSKPELLITKTKTNIKDYLVPNYARDYPKCKQTDAAALLNPFEEK